MTNDPNKSVTWHAFQFSNNYHHHQGCQSAATVLLPQAHPLRAKKLVDGIALTIPMEIEVTKQPAFQISDIRCIVSFEDAEICTALDYNIYGPGRHCSTELVAHLPANAIRHIERIRAGAAAKFSFKVYCNVTRVFEKEEKVFGTVPQSFSFDATVSYPREAWVGMLNATGMGDNVVVEIPLPPCPSDEWRPIWKAIATARDSLKHGGETAWKSAIVECRHALESWQKLEQEDHGPGWKAPTPMERSQRTRQQRLDNLRWDLLQCAHEAAHSPADKWSRDDAILILAALASLMQIRKP